MKLEVGMYVRTKEGGIAKIEEIKPDDVHKTIWCVLDKSVDLKCFYIRKESITKASHNIIDLIEVGDYVNGYFVNKIDNELCNFDLNLMKWLPLKEIDIGIETIVTKEQFSFMEYKANG